MSRASTAFTESIKDAEELLQHFDAINTKPPPANAEVLKRAAVQAIHDGEEQITLGGLDRIRWTRPSDRREKPSLA